MHICIRVDSSIQLGTGHVMRCLTLADQLRQHECEVTFIMRELPGHLCQYVENKGYKVLKLPHVVQDFDWEEDAKQTIAVLKCIGEKIDWLIVDHYSIDIQWELKLRTYVNRIMVIDDLANRRHDCDLLLDQNLYENMEQRYMGLVPETCKLLLGPRYALLRPEFREARKKLRPRDGTVRRILIFFGGTDPTNETLKAIEAVRLLNCSDIEVDVVVGAKNPHRDLIKKKCCELPNFDFHCQVDNMAVLMAKADLAIGAGGSTTWERCYLGLPSLVVVVADNQLETTTFLDKKGCIYFMGRSTEVHVKEIFLALVEMINNPLLIQSMASNALSLLEFNDSEVLIKEIL